MGLPLSGSYTGARCTPEHIRQFDLCHFLNKEVCHIAIPGVSQVSYWSTVRLIDVLFMCRLLLCVLVLPVNVTPSGTDCNCAVVLLSGVPLACIGSHSTSLPSYAFEAARPYML